MERIADLVIRCFEFDVAALSNQWMYWPLCVPALAYVSFMLIKWVVLTCPIWLPVHMIVGRLKIDMAPRLGK